MTVFFFSGSGHGKAVARFFADKLGCEAIPMESALPPPGETAVVVFPVYCEAVPPPVRQFLEKLRTRYAVLIAVYGGICPGNTLYEAQKLTHGTVIAAAAVPAGHTFLMEAPAFDPAPLAPVLSRIETPAPAHIPKRKTHLFSRLFPALRSRIGVRLLCTDACSSCGTCNDVCPMHSMKNGRPGTRCIRCLKCVNSCPQRALHVRVRPFLRRWLTARRDAKSYVYL